MAKKETKNSERKASTKESSFNTSISSVDGMNLSKKQKKGTVHPKFRMIEIVEPNGERYTTYSTYGSSDVLKLEVSKSSHPAWTKEANYVNVSGKEVSMFNKRFAGLSFLKK